MAPVLSVMIAIGFCACFAISLRARIYAEDELYGALAITFLLLAIAQVVGAVSNGMEVVFLIRLYAFCQLATKIVRLGLAS